MARGQLQRIDAVVEGGGVVSVPTYDRAALECGIVHLGVGNFHRSHQATYVHELLQAEPGDWMIHGIACLDTDLPLVAALRSQDCRFTVTERSASAEQLKVIGSIKRITHAPTEPEAALAALSSPLTKVISLTVTEKGYCATAEGDLDEAAPAVAADLEGDGPPRTVLGHLFAAARERMKSHGAAVAVQSCDNLPGNGRLTRRLLLQFAERKDLVVAQWIDEHMTFPCSMVDRITPITTAATVDDVADRFGVIDVCPVTCEDFRQWVTEDAFPQGRPALEQVGVQYVADVHPYEVQKVRLLNGSHSALAYAAYLMGYRAVDQAMEDPLIERFVQRYMEEDVAPTVPPVPGTDVQAYGRVLRQRFANPAISDQVQRLAMDGSQKIRNAIVPPLREQLAGGGSIRWMAFALAAWYRYLRAVDEAGAPIDVMDPMAAELTARAQGAPLDPLHLLAVDEIFGSDLATDARALGEVTHALRAIDAIGVREALSRALAR